MNRNSRAHRILVILAGLFLGPVIFIELLSLFNLVSSTVQAALFGQTAPLCVIGIGTAIGFVISLEILRTKE